MSDTLYNGFNNGRDASDGIGGQPNPLNITYVLKSKSLQTRHEEVKAEMIKTLEAMKLLEDQYNELQSELYSIEKDYVDNLKNLVE